MSVDLAIVGMAAVFPGAADLQQYWQNIIGGVDATTEAPPARLDPAFYDPGAWDHPVSDRFYCRRGGFIDDVVDFDPQRFGIMPNVLSATEPDQLIALTVAADAVADAGGGERLGDPARVGVIVGRGGYITAGIARLDHRVRVAHQLVTSVRELVPDLPEAQLEQIRQAFHERLGPEQPEASIGLVPNLAASRIANRLDLQGPAFTVDAACASSLVAVDAAAAELQSGRCDAVIAGGVHVCHDLTVWSVFTQLRALSPSQSIRPFDRRADGVLMGEGVGMVVLRRLADAERDGDRIYAVVRGVGVASDGRASTLMRPRVEGQMLAVQRAWQSAGLDPTAPDAIGLVEAHGTATPTGDETELTTLHRTFGAPNRSRIGIGSVKSMIGHTMPASGMAGLIKAALAVHHGVLPPTLHCDEPHPALDGSWLRPITATEEWDSAGGVRRAVVNAFGFGGINAHAVVEEPPGTRNASRVAPRPEAPTEHDRVLLLAGPDTDDLARQLDADDATLVRRDDLATPPHGPCRLAIVDPTPKRLALARKVVARGTSWRGRNDVWFTADPLFADPGARLAFVFPGIEHTFVPRIDDVAEHFDGDAPRFDATASVGHHGAATVQVSRLLHTALRGLNVHPDVVAGHSVGEWTAMIAAGVFADGDVDAFLASFDPHSLEVPGVLFAALGCGAETAQAAIADLPDIVVSHDNCPHQSIVCGMEASIGTALERLKAEGVLGQVMNFRSGFHSPMFEPYLDPIRAHIERQALSPPMTPIWSATTLAPYQPAIDDVRELFLRHLVEPVRFGPLIARLHDEGVRGFVQVGTGSLVGFIDDALRDRDVLAVSANVAKRSGLDQLRRVAAALWVEGRAVSFERLVATPQRSDVARHGDASTASGTAVPLDLSVPVVHLGDLAAGLTIDVASSSAADRLAVSEIAGDAGAASYDPVVAQFEAVLRDATSAATEITESWQRWSAATQARPAGSEERPATSPRTSTTTVTVSLDTMPFLADHCFVRQPPGWPVADRHPVLPMTTMLELMMDAARPLAGGRTIVGLRQVRAVRWLACPEPVDVTIVATVTDEGNVDVSLDGYSQGTVVLGDGYEPAPEPSTERLDGEEPSPITPRQLYDDRWMFHGPQFQGVRAIDAVASNGIRGAMVALPATGSLLDNAGHFVGYWITNHYDVDRTAFPIGFDELRFHGPEPGPGAMVGCTVWVRDETHPTVRADVELRHSDGSVWAQIEGWQDRRFSTDELVWPIMTWPEVNRLAQPEAADWYVVRDRWPGPANRDLIMRRYLNAAERAEYEQQGPRGQGPWLSGRIAVKDAVRQLLWDGGAGPIFPGEIAVSNDAGGRPVVHGNVLPEPVEVSLAHAGRLGVARARWSGTDAAGIGIDVERIEERDDSFAATAFSDDERSLIDEQHELGRSRHEWTTRMWCAKEAVAKAEGTGLGGRPRRFLVQHVEGEVLDVLVLDEHTGEPARRHRVATCVIDDVDTFDHPVEYVVAWTVPLDDELVTASSSPTRTSERPDGGPTNDH